MRVEIKTKGPVKDNDVRALYLLREALRISSPHMKRINVDFAWDSYLSETQKK